METFFLVIRENSEGDSFSCNPKVRHKTLGEAKKEAERLCAKEGKIFLIFELIGFMEQTKPPIAWNPIKE